MNEIARSIVNMDDSQLMALIDTAQKRLVFMCPGLSLEVARVIADRWQGLGPDQVKVILDIDPEVARLGYGSLEGLELIQKEAERLGVVVFHQPGIRIGLLILDESTIIFSPRPLLIEASSTQGFQPNAIWLDHVPSLIVREIGWGQEGGREQSIGLHEVTLDQIESVKTDLLKNPPQKFDISRIVQVFNSRFEFVEVEVRGCSISRKTAMIPTDLMPFINDPIARSNLHSTYQIVREGSELSGQEIREYRKDFIDKLLVQIPDFGSVVLRENKEELLSRIEALKQKIEKFQNDIRKNLQQEIDQNCNILVQSLLPAVLQNPPQRWRNQIGPRPSNKDIEAMLGYDLRESFGTADALIQKMEIRCLFKGITYEMLKDPKFVVVVHKAIPTIRVTHDEFEAARAVQDPLF
jgi:hypothetical protein